MATPNRSYLPAAGKDAFLSLYDPITRLFGIQRALRSLLDQARLEPGQTVLDIGCGTGTLDVLIKRRYPTVEVMALDPDPKALALAQRKAAKGGVAIRFDRGFADALPYKDGAFDRVFSSMMFHHLRKDDRSPALAEVRRVLKPGGRLEFLDFSGGHHSLLGGLIHGHQASPTGEDRLIARMRDVGFTETRRLLLRRTLFGPIAFYQAQR